MSKEYCVNVWVTRECNFRCRYCYENGSQRVGNMDMKTATKVVNFIEANVKKEQKLVVIFHGGEPLLNYEVICYFVKELKKKFKERCQFGLTTNGSLLDKDKINYIAFNMAHDISISIDGDLETQRMNRVAIDKVDYNQIVKNALELNKRVEYLRIRMTITPEVVGYFFRNVKYLIELGFKYIVPALDVFNKNWTDEHFDKLFQEYIKLYQYMKHKDLQDVHVVELSNEFKCVGVCQCGEEYYNVDVTGEIYPCTFVVGDSMYKMGDVINGFERDKVEEFARKNRVKIELCSECKMYDCCEATRCLFLNAVTIGDMWKPNLVECNLLNLRLRIVSKLYI